MLRKRLVCWSALPILCIIVASWSFSLALRGGWLRRSLSANLAASFGRPVEVARFGFTILGGPKFEADSVTVGEDPRFGQEYFLRAGRLTASLRWAALLHGRMEFDRLWLSEPSLNLVRSADGQWNIETWLPPVNTLGSLPVHNSPPSIPAHASRIDIQSGRINFKKGTEKLPFALVDVVGSVNLQRAGRWSLDLQAHPMRAAIVLQRSGALRLQGTIGGTSARLQPADLRLSWEGASLADAARLARGTDYGLRGLLDADFTARSDRRESAAKGGVWKIEGGFRLQAVHRWNLVARPDNPALNVSVAAAWYPADSRLEMEHWLVEAPHSNLDGEARIEWAHGFNPEVRLLKSQVGLPDLINWGRAFFQGRVEEIDSAGSVSLQAELGGRPLGIEDLTVSSDVASIRSDSAKLPPIRFGPIQAFWSHSSLVLAPVAVRLYSSAPSRATRGAQSGPLAEGLFHIEGALGPIRPGDGLSDWAYKLTISGETGRVQDMRAVAGALGHQLGSNWNIEGPASLQLVCSGALRPGTSFVHGQLDFHDLLLTNSAVIGPVLISAARVEFAPGERRIKIGDAQALGTRWNARLQRKTANGDWTFDVSANRLDLADLSRGLEQNRQGLLYRIFAFSGAFRGAFAASSALAPETEAAIAGINAHGHLHIDELKLSALRLESLDAIADVERGNLTFRRAQADLYGGRVSGEFRAEFAPEPRYSFRGQVDRTDLSALAALTSIKNGLGGIGSGEVELVAHGLGRQELLASLQGEGFLHIQNAAIDLLDLPTDWTDSSFREIAGNHFRSSTVSFRVQDGRVRVDPWLLSERQRQLEIVGDIDFSRRLDLQVRSISQPEGAGPASESPAADEVWVVGGTLDAPQMIREERVSAGNQPSVRTGQR